MPWPSFGNSAVKYVVVIIKNVKSGCIRKCILELTLVANWEKFGIKLQPNFKEEFPIYTGWTRDMYMSWIVG
jgi:hypothetical protein